jgi:ATP:ADP antiporter, AAA family
MSSPSDTTPRDEAARSGLYAVLSRVVDVRRDETRAMLMSAAFFFFVLSGYFVLRPIRDEIAVTAGTSKLPWLFTGTLIATLICNPLFSALVVRFPARKFIPITYHAIAVCLLAFYVVRRVVSAGAEASSADVKLGIAFFIWTSAIALFVTSVFWCFMADVFRSEQAKRLFGFIGVGGTLGSLTGTAMTSLLVKSIGTSNLLLVSALLFELGVLVVRFFPATSSAGRSEVRVIGGRARAIDDDIERRVIGGSAWAGVRNLLESPYLLGIAVFLILYTVGSTILYFQQSDIVGRYYANKAVRTQVLANIELGVQLLTVLTQAFFTGRIIRWIGLGATLAVMPALSALGFAALGAVPLLATVVGFTVLRRGSNFALTNPAMEALFTVVSREDKYKAKSFIETFVYRGGDQIAAWTYAGLSALGLGLTGISYAAVPMCAAWLALGVWLGRRQASLAGAQSNVPLTGALEVKPA